MIIFILFILYFFQNNGQAINQIKKQNAFIVYLYKKILLSSTVACAHNIFYLLKDLLHNRKALCFSMSDRKNLGLLFVDRV